LGVVESELRKALWGEDYYLDSKKQLKRVQDSSNRRAGKPLFVQMILENIWTVYDAALIHP
jgi:ribosome assembly protein 1